MKNYNFLPARENNFSINQEEIQTFIPQPSAPIIHDTIPKANMHYMTETVHKKKNNTHLKKKYKQAFFVSMLSLFVLSSILFFMFNFSLIYIKDGQFGFVFNKNESKLYEPGHRIIQHEDLLKLVMFNNTNDFQIQNLIISQAVELNMIQGSYSFFDINLFLNLSIQCENFIDFINIFKTEIFEDVKYCYVSQPIIFDDRLDLNQCKFYRMKQYGIHVNVTKVDLKENVSMPLTKQAQPTIDY